MIPLIQLAETEGMIHKVLDLESQSLESQSLESQSLELQSLESQS